MQLRGLYEANVFRREKLKKALSNKFADVLPAIITCIDLASLEPCPGRPLTYLVAAQISTPSVQHASCHCRLTHFPFTIGMREQ